MCSVETLADDALAIMYAEGVDRFHLAGHSMGGLVAQEVALRARERVLSLTLLCTCTRGKDATAMSGPCFAPGFGCGSAPGRCGVGPSSTSSCREIIARTASGRALSAAIPGSAFVELNSLGHGAPIAAPGRISGLIFGIASRGQARTIIPGYSS